MKLMTACRFNAEKMRLEQMRYHPLYRDDSQRGVEDLVLLKTWIVFVEDGLREMARRLGWKDGEDCEG